MLRRMGKKGYRGLDGSIAMFSRLLMGQRLTATLIERDLGVQRAAARRCLQRLLVLPGVLTETIDREPGVKLPTLSARPSAGPVDVAAACLMSSLATAVRDTNMRAAVERIRANVVSASKNAHDGKDLDRKFWFVVRGGESALPRKEKTFSDVIEAILKSRAITFDYVHFEGRRERDIRVKPLTLAMHEHQFYVIAQRTQGDIYAYRFSRTSRLRTMGKFKYPSRDEYDPSRLFEHEFGIYHPHGTVEEIQIRLSPTWRTYVASHRWHETQEHTVDQLGRTLLRLKVRVSPEVKRWIIWFGADAEVIAPAHLRSEVAERLKAAAGNYTVASARKRKHTTGVKARKKTKAAVA